MKIFLIILGSIVFVFSGITYFSFKKTINTSYEKYENSTSKIFKSSLGDVEYQIKGEGIPVLVVHGIVGGVDQAVITGENIFGNGYKIIGVSRFGYLNSDLPNEPTPKNQAKAYKELLDYLNIKRVIILAASAGGAPAYSFVLDYPEKTESLVLIGSSQPENKEIKGPLGPPSIVLNDFMFWAMANPLKKMIMPGMFGIDKELYNKSSKKEKEILDKLFEAMLPIKPRKSGIINDTKITNADMIKNYNKYDLGKINKKVLIFHAKNDPMASYDASVKAQERLPNSKLYSFESGGHIIYGQGDKIQNILNEIFK